MSGVTGDEETQALVVGVRGAGISTFDGPASPLIETETHPRKE